MDTRPINFSAFSNRSGNEATPIAVTHSLQAFTFLYSSPNSQQSILHCVVQHLFILLASRIPQTKLFVHALHTRQKARCGHIQWENLSLIIKCINTLLHQSDCSGMIIYKYHHSTKPYHKISQVCCHLYCYECAARVTMLTATNE